MMVSFVFRLTRQDIHMEYIDIITADRYNVSEVGER